MGTIYLSLSAQVAVGTFYMKSPVPAQSRVETSYIGVLCIFYIPSDYFPGSITFNSGKTHL